MQIKLKVENVELEAHLGGSPIARALAAKLPLQVQMSRWGDEYCGSVGLGMENDPETREDVEVGTVAYWPSGDALCIFFGPTPMSSGDVPRAAAPVTVLGMVTAGDVRELRALGSSVDCQVSAVE